MFQDKSSYGLPSTNGNARGGKKYLFCSDTGTQIKVVIGINIVLVILTVILLVVNSLWLNPGKPQKCFFKLKFNSNFFYNLERFIRLKTYKKLYSQCKRWENFTIWTIQLPVNNVDSTSKFFPALGLELFFTLLTQLLMSKIYIKWKLSVFRI